MQTRVLIPPRAENKEIRTTIHPLPMWLLLDRQEVAAELRVIVVEGAAPSTGPEAGQGGNGRVDRPPGTPKATGMRRGAKRVGGDTLTPGVVASRDRQRRHTGDPRPSLGEGVTIATRLVTYAVLALKDPVVTSAKALVILRRGVANQKTTSGAPPMEPRPVVYS